MKKKLGLHVGGRRLEINVTDEFADYLENELTREFNMNGNNDLQLVLQAYIRKTHEIFGMEKDMQKLLRKLNKASMT